MKPEDDIKDRDLDNLEAFRDIDVEADWQKVKGRIGFGPRTTLFRVGWAAAVVILLIGVGYLSQQYIFSPPEMVTALAGDKLLEVNLPDGSEVTLRQQAELVYPEKFTRRMRELSLSGEAFFKVVSDPVKPFRVIVEDEALVQVLGTSFGILPRKGSGLITVQVVEGKVSFSGISPDSPSMVLVMNEQATMSDGRISMDAGFNRNMLSWKTGVLFFDQDLIGEVVRQLEIHYNTVIVLDESVPEELTFTSVIDNQELVEVLEEMSMVLGVEFTIGEDQVTISKPE